MRALVVLVAVALAGPAVAGATSATIVLHLEGSTAFAFPVPFARAVLHAEGNATFEDASGAADGVRTFRLVGEVLGSNRIGAFAYVGPFTVHGNGTLADGAGVATLESLEFESPDGARWTLRGGGTLASFAVAGQGVGDGYATASRGYLRLG